MAWSVASVYGWWLGSRLGGWVGPWNEVRGRVIRRVGGRYEAQANGDPTQVAHTSGIGAGCGR